MSSLAAIRLRSRSRRNTVSPGAVTEGREDWRALACSRVLDTGWQLLAGCGFILLNHTSHAQLPPGSYA